MSDNGHVTFENIKELRKFVNAEFTDEFSHLGDTWVVFNLDKCIVDFFFFLLVEVAFCYNKIVTNQHNLLVANHHL